MGHVKRQTDQDEAVPKCGSFEVRFPDGRPSEYFYWDDLTVCRLRPDLVASEVPLEQAKALASAGREEHQTGFSRLHHLSAHAIGGRSTAVLAAANGAVSRMAARTSFS